MCAPTFGLSNFIICLAHLLLRLRRKYIQTKIVIQACGQIRFGEIEILAKFPWIHTQRFYNELRQGVSELVITVCLASQSAARNPGKLSVLGQVFGPRNKRL